MRINCSISTINEEAKFTKTTAIADKFINVCMSFRISCTLECEICKMSALSFFYSFCQCFDSLEVHEVNACVCTHSLGKFKTFLISVYCADMFNTHSTEYCDTDQANRSASLNNYSAVETKDSCCFCSLYCMYKYCTWLNEDSGIQIQITYIKECSSEISTS